VVAKIKSDQRGRRSTGKNWRAEGKDELLRKQQGAGAGISGSDRQAHQADWARPRATLIARRLRQTDRAGPTRAGRAPPLRPARAPRRETTSNPRAQEPDQSPRSRFRTTHSTGSSRVAPQTTEATTADDCDGNPETGSRSPFGHPPATPIPLASPFGTSDLTFPTTTRVAYARALALGLAKPSRDGLRRAKLDCAHRSDPLAAVGPPLPVSQVHQYIPVRRRARRSRGQGVAGVEALVGLPCQQPGEGAAKPWGQVAGWARSECPKGLVGRMLRDIPI